MNGTLELDLPSWLRRVAPHIMSADMKHAPCHSLHQKRTKGWEWPRLERPWCLDFGFRMLQWPKKMTSLQRWNHCSTLWKIIIHSMFGPLWRFSRSIYGSGSSICKVNFAELDKLDEKKCRKLACLVVYKSHRFRSVSPGTNDFRDPGYRYRSRSAAAQPLTFINQRTLPVSTRTLSIVNSSPVLWQVADAEKYGIYMNLPRDFVRFTNKYRKNAQKLPMFVGDEWVGPCRSHWVHLEDFPPWNPFRHGLHRETSQNKKQTDTLPIESFQEQWALRTFLNFGTVW